MIDAPDRLVGTGLLVQSCFEHTGAARALVHALKYRGTDRAGWLLARALTSLLPATGVLVPLPRASWRTITYGIDPALDLARRIRSLTGRSVWMGLLPPLHKPGQAGRPKSQRDPPEFTLKSEPPDAEIILLDDVITTGRTMLRAQLAFGDRPPVVALTATATSD